MVVNINFEGCCVSADCSEVECGLIEHEYGIIMPDNYNSFKKYLIITITSDTAPEYFVLWER